MKPERKIIKQAILEDWEQIQNYFGKRLKLKIYWHKWYVGKTGRFVKWKNEEYVATTLKDDVNWFFNEGGRENVRLTLIHEMLHAIGFRHDYRGRKKGFYASPSKDTYSKSFLDKIFKP